MRHYGFDQPLHVRYKRWLVDDRLGLAMKSYHYTDKSAWQLIATRIPVSLAFGPPILHELRLILMFIEDVKKEEARKANTA